MANQPELLNYIIVTNTYKRELYLVERSLSASLHQKILPQKVILLDQNEPPLKLAGDILTNPLLEIQKRTIRSVSGARNSLIIPEKTQWIVFCDDDGFMMENYSEKLYEIIRNNSGLEIIAGSIVREDNKKFYSPRHNRGSLKYFRYTKNLMGSNFAVKASVFEKLGRFDDNFGAGAYWGSSEETDFCWKAFFEGINMEYCSELVVYHVPPFQENLKKGFEKSFKYGVGKGALVWKWLVKRKKMKVFYEFFEMLFIPFVQMVRGLLLLKFQLIPNSVATISGRLYGLFKAAIVNK